MWLAIPYRKRRNPAARAAAAVDVERADPRSPGMLAGCPPEAGYGTGVAPPTAMRTILAAVLALAISASTVGIAMAESDEELAREQDRVEKHLLRVQQERFEAQARGEEPKKLKRLEREFKRTYSRRMDVIEERKAAAAD